MSTITPLKKARLFSYNQSCNQSYNQHATKRVSYRPLTLAIALAFSSVTQAATFEVTNINDSGAGSLRDAINLANTTTGDDTITFNSNLERGTIQLVTEIVVGGIEPGNPPQPNDDSLTITGPIPSTPNGLIIESQNGEPIFNVTAQNPNSSLLTLENMTLTRSLSYGYYYSGPTNQIGGAIVASNTDLTLNNSVLVEHNVTEKGGGIFGNNSDVVLNNTSVSGNGASGASSGIDNSGGGIYADNITLNQSIVAGNSASGANAKGAGLAAKQTVILTDSTVSENALSGDSADGGGINAMNVTLNQSTVSSNNIIGDNSRGGGIFAGGVTLIQSTVSNNYTNGYSSANGAGLSVSQNSIIQQSTITNNSSNQGAGGLHADPANSPTITLENSILSGNTGNTGNFGGGAGVILNTYYSLFGDDLNEISFGASGYGVVQDNVPNLEPLSISGGSTLTHKPQVDSPTLNMGLNSLIPLNASSDQRGVGFSRIQDTTVDMGSVEREAPFTVTGNNEILKRREMVKALIEARTGPPTGGGGTPGSTVRPYATGLEYHDVQALDRNAKWIEAFKLNGFTEGCATDKFCADMVVTREQMAKIFLIFRNGTFSQPPPFPSFGPYSDVPAGSFNVQWINALKEGDTFTGDQFTQGCATDKFCPKQPVTKQWFNFLLAKLILEPD